MTKAIDFEGQLQSVPIRNEGLAVSSSEHNSDALIIEVQLRYAALLKPIAAWVKARKRKRYELAGVSREMFEKIDGETTVEQLIDWLCDQEHLTFLEGRALVTHYLRDLMKRGLIVVAALAA